MNHNGVDLSSVPTATEEPAAEKQVEAVEVATAFVLALSPDGVWAVLNDFNTPLRLQRAPSPDDMYAGCAVVQKDISAQTAAMHTQRAMLQLTQQMQQQHLQQQQAANIASKLGNLRG